MPLLPKEPDRFPEDVTARDGPPWWVAHVRSRQEKVLARHLHRHMIPYFLPQTRREWVSGGRRRESRLPLFRGYVFFRAERSSLSSVWESGVVANLIEVEDQRQIHDELEQIAALLDKGAVLSIYEELLPGDPVRIEEGPFSGYSGLVVRRRNAERLVVRVSLIHRNVIVEFGRDVLRRTAEGAKRLR